MHAANPDSEDAWLRTSLDQYRVMMDELHIEKAVIMPLNDPWLMSMAFTVDAVHQHLREMKQRYPGRFYAFADVDTRNTPARSAEAIARALDCGDLDGVKIHPNNTGIALDDAYNDPIFSLAQQRKIPVAIHSYPNREDDVSAARRILKVRERYPDLTLIVSHMSAFQWEALLPIGCHVDMSAILPDYVRTFGIARTEEILRSFGTDQLLFATDYPDSRSLPPAAIYAVYFDTLDQMHFTEEEAKRIAFQNAKALLA